MIIPQTDTIDLSEIFPGDTLKLKRTNKQIVTSLLELAGEMGCKLIFTEPGEFYFKEYLSTQRNNIINNILNDEM